SNLVLMPKPESMRIRSLQYFRQCLDQSVELLLSVGGVAGHPDAVSGIRVEVGRLGPHLVALPESVSQIANRHSIGFPRDCDQSGGRGWIVGCSYLVWR